MRITSNIIQRDALASMQGNLRAMSEASRQVSTGLRIGKASDDPAGASGAMRARSSLRALEQYRSNITSAASRATAEENVLDQINDVMVRAKELALSQAGANASDTTRQAVRAEVDELLSFVVQLGNTRFGEEYLFAGQHGSQAPFDASQPGFVPLDADGDPIVPQGARQTEISSGHYLAAGHDGQEVFLDTGVLHALRDLSNALGGPSPEEEIATALGGLDDAFAGVQNLFGEIGARASQLEVTGANLEALTLNLETLRSDLEEVDVEKAITELVTRQTAYQAAMLATSRIMGVTLADYLR